MNEFIKKLIERLEEESFWTDSTFDEDGYSNDDSDEVVSLYNAKEIVNQLAEEYNQDSTKNNQGWILCSSGRMPEEYDSIFAKAKGTDKWNDAMFEKISDIVNVTVVDGNGNVRTTHAHTVDGKWSCDLLKCNKSYRIIAWREFPAPYQPKGE